MLTRVFSKGFGFSIFLFLMTGSTFAASPTFSSSPNTAAEDGTAYTYTARGTDSDGDWLTYTIINKPSWLNASASTPLTTISGTLGVLGTPANGYTSPGASDGGADGSLAINAKHRYANFLAFDNQGVLHISDNEQNVIRRIDETTGQIYTVAGQLGVYTGGGATSWCSYTNGAGNGATAAEVTRYGEGGLATAATLCEVDAIRFDNNNNLILSDYGSLTIRKVDKTTGVITTIMGAQNAGTAIVIGPTAATTSKVHQVWDMAIDQSNNNIYIADTSSNVIRKYDATAQTLTVIAGAPQGHVVSHPVPLSEAGLDARLYAPHGLALTADGSKLYFSERYHHLIRVLDTATNVVTVIAGDRTIPGEGSGSTGSFSGDGGAALSATLNEPKGLALSPDENDLYVNDGKNQRIRKINLTSGIITTIAGTGVAGTSGDGGTATSADLNGPNGITLSPDGDIYFGDASNNAFRKITTGIVLSGTPSASDVGTHSVTVRVSDGTNTVDQTFTITVGAKTPSFTSTAATAATENSAYSYTARASDVSSKWLTYAVTQAPSWLSAGASTPITTVSGTLGVLGTPANGYASPGASDGGADGSLAINAKHRYANFLAFDNDGVLYISDNEQNVVRRIDETTGQIYTVAGQLGVYTGGGATTWCSYTNGAGNGATAAEVTRYGEGGLATAATLCEVDAIRFDSNNNLIISDYGSLTIRKVDKTTGIITTIMGAQNAGTAIVTGPTAATTSKVHQVWDMAVDQNNDNIYIADTGSNVIRKYDSAAQTITVIAGAPQGHVTAHPVPISEAGLDARLYAPHGLALTSDGSKLYFSERYHHLIRVLDTATNVVTVIAGDRSIPGEGSGSSGSFSGDDGPALLAHLNEPKGLALSPDEKHLYISDSKNQRIRKLDLVSGIITTVAGTGVAGTTGEGSSATSVQLNGPNGLVFSADGDLYFGDASNNAFRKTTNGIVLTGTPTNSDVGDHTVTITATDADGYVATQSFTVTVANVNDTPTGSVAISGTATQNEILTASNTLADVDGLGTISYQWNRGGSAISGASSTTYTLVQADVGQLITVTASYTDGHGTLESVNSTATSAVVNTNDNPTGAVTISGTITEGETLTASNSLADDDGLGTITYQWYRNGTAISGANASTYVLTAGDIGATITVAANYTDALGTAESRASSATSTVNGLPVVTAPDAITLDATGLFTKVELGQGTATDAEDGALTPTANSDGYFSPGAHTVTWSATDSTGGVGSATQTINVIPLVGFSKNQDSAEGSTASFKVILNGPAVTYPVTIPYTVGGTAATDGSDHNLTDGTITIENPNLEATVSVSFVDDGAGEGVETLIITMGTPSNAAKGAVTVHTIDIYEDNVAPEVELSADQGSGPTRLIGQTSGLVTITANVTDPNSSDTHSYDWSATDNALVDTDSTAETFTLNPNSLTPGVYTVKVTVSDGQASSKALLYLKVEATLPTLTSADSDNDGVSDDTEGTGDSDGDGIPDYLDNADIARNVVQEQQANASAFLMETEPGLRLRLGQVAFRASGNRTGVSASEITEHANNGAGAPADNAYHEYNSGLFDFNVEGLPLTGQSVRIVIAQFAAIPADAVYRKLMPSGWQNFVVDANNSIASALGSEGYCPPPGDAAYTTGLTEGHWCVQLTIEDGGPNDADGEVNQAIDDPGGVARKLSEQLTLTTRGSGGGSIGLWSLVCLVGLALWHRRRERKLIGAALLLLPLSAQATDLVPDYAGVSLLRANSDERNKDFNRELSSLGLNAAVTQSNLDRNGGSVYLGYVFESDVRMELGYVDLGDVKTRISGSATDVTSYINSAQGVYPATASGFTYALGKAWQVQPQTKLCLSIGTIFWNAEYHLRSAAADRRFERDGMGAQFGLALEWDATANLPLRLGWRNFRFANTQVNSLEIGASYRFQ